MGTRHTPGLFAGADSERVERAGIVKIKECRFCGAQSLQPIELDTSSRVHGQAQRVGLIRCAGCGLVQLAGPASHLIPRRSSRPAPIGSAQLHRARDTALEVIERLGLGRDSHVVAIGPGDLCLAEALGAQGIPLLVVDPSAARRGSANGCRAIGAFFGAEVARVLARQYGSADLLIVADIAVHSDMADLVAGLAALLKPEGIIVAELDSVLDVVESGAVDRISADRVFYPSLTALERVFGTCGLHLNDGRRLAHREAAVRVEASTSTRRSASLERLLGEEQEQGVVAPAFYRGLARLAAVFEGEGTGRSGSLRVPRAPPRPPRIRLAAL